MGDMRKFAFGAKANNRYIILHFNIFCAQTTFVLRPSPPPTPPLILAVSSHIKAVKRGGEEAGFWGIEILGLFCGHAGVGSVPLINPLYCLEPK